ncbi:MAG: hypothetical protein K2K93_01500 [Muribaculaceae bacterium]|nr:hypothetical protein [Muribaculaceae bacterium]
MNIASIKYLIVAAVAAATSSISAQTMTDWGEIMSGTVYEYEAKTPVAGFYVASSTGQIRCYSTGAPINAYSDAEHNVPIESADSYYGPEGEKVRLYPTVQGETIYFYNNYPLDGGTFRLADGTEEITMPTISPAPGNGEISMSEDYSLLLVFNIPVKISKCKMESGSASAEMPLTITHSSVAVNWHSTLMDWYETGKIKGGDVMTLTFTGIRDEYDSLNRPDYGDGLGKLILRFTLAAEPARLTEQYQTPQSGTADFLSYYLPDGDEGVVRLVFNRELQPDCEPEVILQYGDPDNLELGLYIENPPVSVSGHAVEVDLRGVKRLPEEMVPGLAVQPTISLRISGIKSNDGQYVLTGNVASPYTFEYIYSFRTLSYSIAADWYPLPGSELKGGENMEIWVLNGNRIKFDSVDFTFMKNLEYQNFSIPYQQLSSYPDPDYPEAMIFNLTAPELDADSNSDIAVSFGGLQCADGLDHTQDIYVRYRSGSTGVTEAAAESDDTGAWYDINGRPAARDSRGILIHNGKKTISR